VTSKICVQHGMFILLNTATFAETSVETFLSSSWSESFWIVLVPYCIWSDPCFHWYSSISFSNGMVLRALFSLPSLFLSDFLFILVFYCLSWIYLMFIVCPYRHWLFVIVYVATVKKFRSCLHFCPMVSFHYHHWHSHTTVCTATPECDSFGFVCIYKQFKANRYVDFIMKWSTKNAM
jgi:hypothetical protein